MPALSNLKAIAQERVAVDNTSGGVRLTFSNFLDPPLAKAATITVETASIRYLTDGTAPTSSTGTLAYSGDKITLNDPSELWNFRAIRTGGTSATIQVVYLGD